MRTARVSRRALLAGIFACAAVTLSSVTFASGVGPKGQLRWVVGVPPGGTTDMMARLVSNKLDQLLGVSSFIENRAGASGMIGAAHVAKAKPDGSTLLVTASSHATLQFLYPEMPYDTDNDLVPVGLIASTPYVLAVHPSVPASNFKELVELLKAKPGEYAYASTGNGNAQHLAGEMLQKMGDFSMVHVPYKGSGALWPDVLAGRVPILFENVAIMQQHIRSGAMRPLAVTASTRLEMLPDIPTLAESGLDGFEVLGWFGIWAPTGTPEATIDALNAAVNQALHSEDLQVRLQELGALPMPATPSEQAAWLRSEQHKWGGLIKELKISAQ